MRLLVIGDSDSYVKWGAALASRMPGWERRVVLLQSPVQPSASQLAAALAGTDFAAHEVAVTALADIPSLIEATRPDAVLLAVRGPVVRVVARAVRRAVGRAAVPRPVLVSGLPGITIPAVAKAVDYRRLVDLVVLHSRREVREFRSLAALHPDAPEFGLATLPFVPDAPSPGQPDGDIVFAAQAIVPRALEQRRELVEWLAACASNHPDRRVVIKVRGAAGEPQTHTETYDFASLFTELAAAPPNLVVEGGPMSQHLARASALVTVSSTAAVEAVAAGTPVLLIDEFGVSPALINTVFEGSGLFGGRDDLIAGRFAVADPAWLDDNYLHGREHDDWMSRLLVLLAARDRGALPWRHPEKRVLGGALRHAWDRRRELGEFDTSASGTAAMLIGTPARWAVRRARRLARRLP